MKDPEIPYQEFEIVGWGILQVSDWEGRCGKAVGNSFQMKGDAGGVMDYKDMRRLGEFLIKKAGEGR